MGGRKGSCGLLCVGDDKRDIPAADNRQILIRIHQIDFARQVRDDRRGDEIIEYEPVVSAMPVNRDRRSRHDDKIRKLVVGAIDPNVNVRVLRALEKLNGVIAGSRGDDHAKERCGFSRRSIVCGISHVAEARSI